MVAVGATSTTLDSLAFAATLSAALAAQGLTGDSWIVVVTPSTGQKDPLIAHVRLYPALETRIDIRAALEHGLDAREALNALMQVTPALEIDITLDLSLDGFNTLH